MYFDLLREEFKESGSRGALSEEQYRTLKMIRDAISTGSIATKSWVDDMGEAPPSGGSVAKQDTLVRRIHQEAIRDLRGILGPSIRLENVEHPCPPYGRADMLYMSDDTAFPVEVKKGTGGHDIVGQILKYRLFMSLRLHYHLYERVVAVTVCAGYEPHVLRELKSNGVKALAYSEKSGRLTLREA